MKTPIPAHRLGGFREFSRAVAAGVVLVAGMVFVGWTFDVGMLKSLIPGMTAMNPGGTALCFLLAGTSLWILAGPVGNRRRWLEIGRAHV